MTLYKNELRDKALELLNFLKKEGIEASFDESSFRDYLVILSVSRNGQKLGKISLYYKPSKNTFSLKKQITDENAANYIDDAWNEINGSGTYCADSGIYEAFVDGSYLCGVTGYGAAVYLGQERKTQLAGTIPDVEFRQFGGELQSVIEVLKWCTANKVSKVRINYDYQGIEKFATGEWKPKNNLSKDYAAFIKNTDIKIEWRHIKSHTGNPKNDEADALAKKAAMSVSGTTSRRFIKLERKALNFIEFINKKPAFAAQYACAENGETVKIKIKNQETKDSSVAELFYAKADNISLKQKKSAIEADIYNFWQEFLFLEDFNV